MTIAFGWDDVTVRVTVTLACDISTNSKRLMISRKKINQSLRTHICENCMYNIECTHCQTKANKLWSQRTYNESIKHAAHFQLKKAVFEIQIWNHSCKSKQKEASFVTDWLLFKATIKKNAHHEFHRKKAHLFLKKYVYKHHRKYIF